MSSKEMILQKTNGRCAYCGKKLSLGKMTKDHVKPLSRGGKNDLCNIVAACRSCNEKKGDCRMEEWRMIFFWETLTTQEISSYKNMVRAIAKRKFYYETIGNKNSE